MKKYTNTILITGLLILLLIISSWFAYFFYQLKNSQVNGKEILDPSEIVTITSSADEKGNTQVIVEGTENGKTKTISINPNKGTYKEVVTEITSNPADTAE